MNNKLRKKSRILKKIKKNCLKKNKLINKKSKKKGFYIYIFL